jgi:hypothetical protein
MKALAGDFKAVGFIDAAFFMKAHLHVTYKGGPFLGERIELNQIAEATVADEESVKRIGGTVGWGVAGAAILGPVGLLAGLLLGGKSKDVTFVAVLKDGRKFMATCSSKEWKQIIAAMFK